MKDEEGKEKDEECLVMYAADAEGDILNERSRTFSAARGGGNDPANDGMSCPPICLDNR